MRRAVPTGAVAPPCRLCRCGRTRTRHTPAGAQLPPCLLPAKGREGKRSSGEDCPRDPPLGEEVPGRSKGEAGRAGCPRSLGGR